MSSAIFKMSFDHVKWKLPSIIIIVSVLVFIYNLFDFLTLRNKYLYICETKKIVNSSHHPLQNQM